MVDAAALLDRAPEPIRRLAYRVAAGEGALGRLADAARFRFSPADVPALPPLREEPVRLFLGPANSAGQGYQWARGIEHYLPEVAAVAMHGIGVGPFQSEADLRVPVAVFQRSSAWHDALEDFLAHQTHVVWESGLPLLGRRYGSDPAVELDRLAQQGVHGALLFHGSDLRPPAQHAAASEWSPFRERTGPVRALEETSARNAALVARTGAPVLVSTPDLLQWQPDAKWFPVVVDAARWRSAVVPREQGRVPIVAHAPSQRWLKGTDRIEPVLHRLAGEGVIEYRRVVNVPHSAMPQFYADADIVLDQFALGSYGVAACEAMASGRLVMSHIDTATRARVRDLTGLDLPVHEATVGSLEVELRRAAADPEAFSALRAAGPAFVEAVHDGRRSAAAIAPFLGVKA